MENFDEARLRLLDEDSDAKERDDELLEHEMRPWQGEPRTYTVEEAVEHMGYGLFQAKIFFLCGLFVATDALEMVLLAVLTPILRCEWQLTDTEVATITTVVFAGMFSMSSVWGSWADKYGRYPILALAAWWIFYFGVLTAFSPTFYWILIMRGLVGAGFGGAVQGFTLQAEYMPSRWRARILICSMIMWALGTCSEIWLAYIVAPRLGWRYLVAFSAFPMMLTIVSLKWMPYSARYLVAAGKKDLAKEVLAGACRLNKTTLPEGDLVESPKVERGRIKDLFTSEYRRTTLQLWVLWFVTAFTYYGVLLASSEAKEFLEACGTQSIDLVPVQCKCEPDYITMIVSTFGEFLAIPLNMATVDWLGRRWTIAIDFMGAGIFSLLLQICVGDFTQRVFFFLIRACVAGIFNIVYIYTTEVYPTMVRSLGLGSSSAMARIGAMITPYVVLNLLHTSVMGTCFVYGGLCIISAIVAFCLPIETKGREMKTTTTEATPTPIQ